MIPSELLARPQWVCWDLWDGRKVPRHPQKKLASTTDSTTWSTYEECASSSDKIGFVFTPDDPYIGIDLDGCRDKETRLIADWAWDVIEKFATYAEVSPSGTGVKLWGIFDGLWKYANKKTLPGNHCGVEVYQTGRYFCVTGQFIAGFEQISNITNAMEWFAEKFELKQTESPQAIYLRKAGSSSVVDRASAYVSKMPPSITGQGGHNQAFHVACVLVNGFMLDLDEARSVFHEFNSRCQPAWSEREIEHKLKSAQNAKGERGQLLNSLASDWGTVTEKLPADWTNAKPKRETTIPALSVLDSLVDRVCSGDMPQLFKLGNALDGLEVGYGLLCVIGAPPGSGKTTLAMQVTAEALEHNPKLHVVVANKETDLFVLMQRELARRTGIAMRGIRFGNLTHRQQQMVREIFVSIRPQWERVSTLEEQCLENLTSLLSMEPGLLIVDYIQLYGPSGDAKQGVAAVMSALRRLARAGWAIVGLSATSRTPARSGGKSSHDSQKLGQASFRDSSEIEFQADSCYLIVDEEPEKPEKKVRRTTLLCVKNRHDEKVSKSLLFNKPKCCFEAGSDFVNDFPSCGNGDPFDVEDE